jgi:hypothetical protein
MMPPRLGLTIQLAARFAADLVYHHGLRPRAAAELGARRYGIPHEADFIMRRLPRRPMPVWRSGSTGRPIARPQRVVAPEAHLAQSPSDPQNETAAPAKSAAVSRTQETISGKCIA